MRVKVPSRRLRRPLALLVGAAIPWVVVPADGATPLVFAWGLVTVDPVSATSLPAYLQYTTALPRRLRAWPAGTFLYTCALAYATVGAWRPSLEDRRVTALLLVLAGASCLLVTVGLLRLGVTALPVGSVALWAAAWWFHWPDLRTVAGG